MSLHDRKEIPMDCQFCCFVLEGEQEFSEGVKSVSPESEEEAIAGFDVDGIVLVEVVSLCNKFVEVFAIVIDRIQEGFCKVFLIAYWKVSDGFEVILHKHSL